MHRTGTLLSGLLLLCQNSSQQGTKHAFWLGPVLQKAADSSLVSLLSHLCKVAFHTGLQLLNNDAQQICPGHQTCFLAQCCSAKTAHSSLVSLQSQLRKFVVHTGLQMPNSDAQQVGPEHQDMLFGSVLHCKHS